ncbi:DEAD/DEAH box helicase [Treponema sp.]|uniref:DEAD/DEAH box helicase n=1 Tax=Treponema sp. TaxID=166 RepID=UPI003F73E53C
MPSEDSQVSAEKTDTSAAEPETISFADLGLDEITLAAIERKGFKVPSPIQVLAIPRLLNGDANVIAKARTGTGKTAAFGLPLVQDLREESDHVRAIILEPTRELAMQTATEMASFTTGKYPRTAVVYGGASMGEQMRALRRGVEIVVGTPGRVQDLIDRGVLDISKIDYFILDEGDEMLDMGFIEDIENIFECANQDCRVLLFSATVPKEILKIAQRFMGEYEIVEEEGFEEEPLLIEQKYWVLRESEKIEALVRLIDISPDFFGLVFVQRKSDADYVSKSLDERGYEAAALHGDIPQGQREKILARFRSKKTRILVATDVAARGIDIEGVTHVVNYELPFDGPTYVHRIGRTGRAGAAGMAVTFVKPEETRRKLNYLINTVKKSSKGEMVEDKVPSIEEVLEAKKSRLFSDIKNKLGLDRVHSEAADSVSENDESSSEEKLPHLRKGDPIFDRFAEELCSGQNPEEVVASLLAVSYGGMLNKNRYGKINSYSVEKGRDRDRGGRRERGSRRGGDAFVGEDQLRLYVQMGWDDGYNPRKIADFFHDLLGVPGRKVDAIDMADKFCLLTLPADDGRKAIELSERDRSLPHMHLDTKVTGAGLGDRDSFGRDRGSRRGGRGRDRGFGRDRDFGGRRDRDRDRGGFRGGSHARAGVHTATQRSGSSSFFKKSDAQEY